MSIELNNLTIEELQNLDERLKKEIKTKQLMVERENDRKERANRSEAMKKVRALIKANNLTMEELLATKTKRAKGEGRKNENKSPPKYRNPADKKQTWTGKGRKPNWVLKALETGNDLEAMIIPEVNNS